MCILVLISLVWHQRLKNWASLDINIRPFQLTKGIMPNATKVELEFKNNPLNKRDLSCAPQAKIDWHIYFCKVQSN